MGEGRGTPRGGHLRTSHGTHGGEERPGDHPAAPQPAPGRTGTPQVAPVAAAGSCPTLLPPTVPPPSSRRSAPDAPAPATGYAGLPPWTATLRRVRRPATA